MDSASIELLISEVQLREPLWDQRCPAYHDRYKNDNAWREIAEIMCATVVILKEKWKNLRDSFRREIKKIPPKHSGDAGPSSMDTQSNWPYFQNMMFLKDQMKPAITESNLDRPSTSGTAPNYIVSVPYVSRPCTPSSLSQHTDDGAEVVPVVYSQDGRDMSEIVDVDDAVIQLVSQSMEPSLAPSLESSMDQSVEQSMEPAKKKKKVVYNFNDLVDMEAKKIQMMQNMFAGPSDANMDFLKSLLPFLQNLPPAQNMQLRQEIQACVLRTLDQ